MRIRLTAGQAPAEIFGPGWTAPEDGQTWAVGSESTARWLIPGLIVAYVDRMDVPPLRNVSASSWLAACRAAYALWIASRASVASN